MEDEITIDRLAKVYIKMRDRIGELTQEYEKTYEDLKAKQAEVASAMKDKLKGLGVESARTEFGTVTLKTNTRYYFTDWEEADKFIIEHEAPFLLERRVSQKMMGEFLEKNPGMVVPALNTTSELTVSVTKPRTK